MPSDTELLPCRNDFSKGVSIGRLTGYASVYSEGVHGPVSALEVWSPDWRPKRMKLLLRTLSLVWRSFKAVRFYEFLRDHFDDFM